MLSELQSKVPALDDGTLHKSFHHDLDGQGYIPSSQD
jgi:hypothetical protein